MFIYTKTSFLPSSYALFAKIIAEETAGVIRIMWQVDMEKVTGRPNPSFSKKGRRLSTRRYHMRLHFNCVRVASSPKLIRRRKINAGKKEKKGNNKMITK